MFPCNAHCCQNKPSIHELRETSGVACVAKGEFLFRNGETEEAKRLFKTAAEEFKFPNL
jgi:hypothetical protein